MKKIILGLLLVSSPVVASYEILSRNQIVYSGATITTTNDFCFLVSPGDTIKTVTMSGDIATGSILDIEYNREPKTKCSVKKYTINATGSVATGAVIPEVIQEPIPEPIDPLFDLFVAKWDEFMKNNEKSKWEKVAFKIIKREAKNKIQKDVINYVLESMK